MRLSVIMQILYSWNFIWRQEVVSVKFLYIATNNSSRNLIVTSALILSVVMDKNPIRVVLPNASLSLWTIKRFLLEIIGLSAEQVHNLINQSRRIFSTRKGKLNEQHRKSSCLLFCCPSSTTVSKQESQEAYIICEFNQQQSDANITSISFQWSQASQKPFQHFHIYGNFLNCLKLSFLNIFLHPLLLLTSVSDTFSLCSCLNAVS